MARIVHNRQVRVIGGRWRGRRIGFPDAVGLRPTPNRVRETLFNWLAPHLPGARVLDLFAGSGILGIEALSRGASSAIAVERNQGVANRIRESGRTLKAADLEVIVSDALRFLETAATHPFDIVFVDPPHAGADYERLCATLDSDCLMASTGFVYLELASRRAVAFSGPPAWERYRASQAGQLSYQLWRRPPGSRIDRGQP